MLIGAVHQLSDLDLAVVAAYFVGLFLLGIYTSRRQKSEEAYFLGGRKTPWFLAGVSIIASLLSTLTYLSTPGEMIGHGIGYFLSLFSLIAVIPAVTLIIIPALMRLRVTSVYDCLERRYGISARMTGASIFLITRLLWVGLIIYAASDAVHAMTGWQLEWVVFLIGLVTIFYTAVGGLEAVIWADVAQFTLLFGGAMLIPISIALRTGVGPVGWWSVFGKERPCEAPFFSWDPTVRLTVVGILLESFLWNFCTHGSDQIAAQRYLSTPSAQSARRSVWVFSLCSLFVTVLLAVCGMSIFYFYFSRPDAPMTLAQISQDADKLMPRFIANELPTGVSGLMLAALLASAMSCLSSGINSISTVVISDFVHRFNPNRKEGVELTLAKVLVAAAGVCGIGIALLVNAIMTEQAKSAHPWHLVDLIARINHLFVAPLGVLFLVGILSRRVGTVAALLGFWLGVLSAILVSLSAELFGMENPVAFTWIMPTAFVVSLVSSYGLGFLFKAPQESQLIGLYAFGVQPAEASAADEEQPVVRVAPSDL